MRPVNLIPADQRGDKTSIRTGPIAYILVGALALALGAVTMVVLTNNKISDRKTEIAGLRQQADAAKVQADQLAPFAQFGSVEEQRTATLTSLADSRFDWERVMRELARVVPGDVWLTNLTGTVSSSVSTSGASSGGSGAAVDSSVTGPSLQLSGCAAGQESVAGFLSALRDIDGVTRVGLSSSDLSDASSGSSGGGGATTNTDCSVRSFVAGFAIVAVFDAVPAPSIPEAAPTAPATGTAPPPASGTSTETTPASDTSATANPGT